MSELVLVIDDDATLLGLMAEHLSRAAYSVINSVFEFVFVPVAWATAWWKSATV